VLVEQVRIRASVARLRSSVDMAKKVASQLTTSAESGGDGDDDIESVMCEDDDDGEVTMAVDLESDCSR